MKRLRILGVDVNVITMESAVSEVLERAKNSAGGYACLCNVHMVLECRDSAEVRKAVARARWAFPDGMPLVWYQRAAGAHPAERVSGPRLTPRLLAAAEEAAIPVGFHGGSKPVIEALVARVKADHPRLQIRYAFSPPFRDSAAEIPDAEVDALRAAGCGILFVGLGCPKQEIWMSRVSKDLNCVMLGVGAAFDFLVGVKKKAPVWIERMGLEWLFRLMTEPRRLWRRYMLHNSRFVLLAPIDLVKHRKRRRNG